VLGSTGSASIAKLPEVLALSTLLARLPVGLLELA
jgi:hypothetical protein